MPLAHQEPLIPHERLLKFWYQNEKNCRLCVGGGVGIERILILDRWQNMPYSFVNNDGKPNLDNANDNNHNNACLAVGLYG